MSAPGTSSMPISSSDRLALADTIESAYGAISLDAVWTWILETGMDGELTRDRTEALEVAHATGKRLEAALHRFAGGASVLLRLTAETPDSFDDAAKHLLELDDLPSRLRDEVERWVEEGRTAKFIDENLKGLSNLLPAEIKAIDAKLAAFKARGWAEGDLSQEMKCLIYGAGFGACLHLFPPGCIGFGVAIVQNCL